MMRYLHTMIRVRNLDKSLHFYCQGLGFEVVKRSDYEKDKFTLVFLRAPNDDGDSPQIELTYNWGKTDYTQGDAYGHTAYAVNSVAAVQERLKKNGYDLSWGPGATPSGKNVMAFVDDPDGYEIELIEKRS
jgi:lactoylglutathione lyase